MYSLLITPISITPSKGKNTSGIKAVTCKGSASKAHQTPIKRNTAKVSLPSFVKPSGLGSKITVIKKSPKFPLELRMLEASVDRVPDSTLSVPEPAANATFADSAAAVSWADNTGVLYEEGFEVINFTFNNPVDFRIGDVLLFTDSTSVPVDFDEDET